MQNLIPGERYYIKNHIGIWEGEVTFVGYVGDNYGVKDVSVVKGTDVERSKRFFYGKEEVNLSGSAEWSWYPVNPVLENE